MNREKCPVFIDFMCPICGIVTGEHQGRHPMAQGIGVDKVMRKLKKVPPEPPETK